MSRYIDAEAIEQDDGLVTVILGDRYYHETIIRNAQTAAVVSQGVVDQIKWERDTAIEQLRSIGKELGAKMDDVQEVSHGRWISIGNTVMAKCSCGFFTDKWKTYHYCPNCGARMVEDE